MLGRNRALTRRQARFPKEQLLGSGPLGQGGGIAAGTPHTPGPYYLINDTFTTDRAAGAVNGTDAEPGPGRRFVVDSASYITTNGGALAISGGGSTWGTSILYFAIPQRTPGRIMLAEVNFANKLFAVVGWSSSSTGLGSSTHNIQFYFRDVLRFWGGDSTSNYGAYNTGTAYQVAAIMRAAGGFLFIKNYVGSYWALLEILNVGTSVCNPQVNSYNAQLAVNYFRVPATPWLPTPQLSDGFSTFAVSAETAIDGLGHAEGIAGGIGSGGDGGWPYTQIGTWQASGGVASASALSSGQALAYIDAEKIDMFASVEVTRSGGTAGLLVRGDELNHVRAVHNGTQVLVIRRLATVDVTLQTTTATYVAGARLIIRCAGDKFRIYYNNVLMGSEQTISDAILQGDSYVGLYTSDTANTFDNLVVYAVGTDGEYAELDFLGFSHSWIFNDERNSFYLGVL